MQILSNFQSEIILIIEKQITLNAYIVTFISNLLKHRGTSPCQLPVVSSQTTVLCPWSSKPGLQRYTAMLLADLPRMRTYPLTGLSGRRKHTSGAGRQKDDGISKTFFFIEKITKYNMKR